MGAKKTGSANVKNVMSLRTDTPHDSTNSQVKSIHHLQSRQHRNPTAEQHANGCGANSKRHRFVGSFSTTCTSITYTTTATDGTATTTAERGFVGRCVIVDNVIVSTEADTETRVI